MIAQGIGEGRRHGLELAEGEWPGWGQEPPQRDEGRSRRAPGAEFAHTDLGAFPVDLSGRGNAVHPVAAHAHIAERGGRDQDGDDDQGL